MKTFILTGVLLLDASAPSRGLDPNNCGVLQVVPALAGDLSAVAFSPDGRRCAVGGTGHVVRVYDVPSWRETCEVKLGERIVAAAFLGDSKRLVVGGEAGIRLLDVEEGKEIFRFSRSFGPTRSISLSPDGKALVSVHGGEMTSFWDVERGVPSVARRNSESVVGAFSRSGDRVALAGVGGIKIWTRRGDDWPEDLRIEGEASTAVAYSKDDRFLLVGRGSGAVSVCNLATAAVERHLPGHQGSVRTLAVTPDDRYALTGAEDGTIRIWDWRKGGELAQLKHPGVRGLALHPTGRMFATVGTDRQIRVWGYVRGGTDRPKVKGFGGISFLKRGGAVTVAALVPGGPAEQAGLKVGDTVRVIGLTAIKEPAEALETIGTYTEGEEAVFEIERNGEEKQVRVRMGRKGGARSP